MILNQSFEDLVLKFNHFMFLFSGRIKHVKDLHQNRASYENDIFQFCYKSIKNSYLLFDTQNVKSTVLKT